MTASWAGARRGNVSFTEEGTLVFKGKLSLENNGGFSSIRTNSDLGLDLGDSRGLVARVKGDGRTYQIRLGTDARYRGMEVSFMAEFPTEKGKWTEVKVSFGEFVGSFRGRTLKDEVLDPGKICRVGLLLADKKPGPFELEVDWIRAAGAGGKQGNIVGVALADGRFGTLAAALTEAGLVEVLQGDGPFTVFAPTDEAFAKLPEGTVENLLKEENLGQLRAILTYHVVVGKVSAGDALNAARAETVNGKSVEFAIEDGVFRVNGATIRTVDLACDNGVIHVIDQVLLPPSDEGLSPAKRIEEAIDQGVPVFNGGDHAKCAKIYKSCLEALIDDEKVSAAIRKALRKVLDRAKLADDARERAWLFRYGLDHAYRAMTR